MLAHVKLLHFLVQLHELFQLQLYIMFRVRFSNHSVISRFREIYRWKPLNHYRLALSSEERRWISYYSVAHPPTISQGLIIENNNNNKITMLHLLPPSQIFFDIFFCFEFNHSLHHRLRHIKCSFIRYSMFLSSSSFHNCSFPYFLDWNKSLYIAI